MSSRIRLGGLAIIATAVCLIASLELGSDRFVAGWLHAGKDEP
jgi:hypothetical protein